MRRRTGHAKCAIAQFDESAAPCGDELDLPATPALRDEVPRRAGKSVGQHA
jgi:hypothetical protein